MTTFQKADSCFALAHDCTLESIRKNGVHPSSETVGPAINPRRIGRSSMKYMIVCCCLAALTSMSVSANCQSHPARFKKGSGSASESSESLLSGESYRSYFIKFTAQERAFLHDDPPAAPWGWFKRNIPLLDVPDKDLETIYYFRWFAFEKHIHRTTDGIVIDEFLDEVPWAGAHNSINAAAEHHLREARWLRDPTYAEEYARFWFKASANPRSYSFPAADSVYSVYLVNGDRSFATGLLSDLVSNYGKWEETNRDTNGLFWQTDDRDGMEVTIGGSGYRPTINSYMYGDAVAIENIAALTGDNDLARRYASKAVELKNAVDSRLWNSKAHFYETATRDTHSSIVNVRELAGYLPWYFNLPGVDRLDAWKQIDDPQGFAGSFGPRTAERRSPRYSFAYPHECLWNGPSWPFATTQTLVAMANVLNGPPQTTIGKEQYFRLLSQYVASQHIQTPDGQQIPWIDEDLDPDTGEWLARVILERSHASPKNRGRYYNHSGFADLIISGLVGVRPETGDTLTINPLLPEKKWKYFALDNLPYHGHLLTVFYDEKGSRYHRGKGLHIVCDGVDIGSSSGLAPIKVRIRSSANLSSH